MCVSRWETFIRICGGRYLSICLPAYLSPPRCIQSLNVAVTTEVLSLTCISSLLSWAPIPLGSSPAHFSHCSTFMPVLGYPCGDVSFTLTGDCLSRAASHQGDLLTCLGSDIMQGHFCRDTLLTALQLWQSSLSSPRNLHLESDSLCQPTSRPLRPTSKPSSHCLGSFRQCDSHWRDSVWDEHFTFSDWVPHLLNSTLLSPIC